MVLTKLAFNETRIKKIRINRKGLNMFLIPVNITALSFNFFKIFCLKFILVISEKVIFGL